MANIKAQMFYANKQNSQTAFTKKFNFYLKGSYNKYILNLLIKIRFNYDNNYLSKNIKKVYEIYEKNYNDNNKGICI